MRDKCRLKLVLLGWFTSGLLLQVHAANTLLPQRAEVFLTAQAPASRLACVGEVKFENKPQPTESESAVFVDPAHTGQTLLGIGGALTDAAAETLYKLPAEKQEEILRAYYDRQTGIGYTLGRTHMNSCDFSSESYSYVKENDKELASFDITHDFKYRIPLIKRAMAAAGGQLTLFMSPWSPPAWMKSNHDMLHGGELKPECYAAWAKYYTKFIRAYEAAGVPIWGLTVQNEPMATQSWESCIFTAQQERDFIKNHLGPELKRAGLGDKKLIAWDHNRDLLFQRARTVLEDPEAAAYVWGVGYHWYSGNEFENMRQVQQAFPKTHLLFTEGCLFPFDSRKLGEWHWGEEYAKSMIQDFNAGAVGWTDWNILLDEKGGPNHVQNYCYAPIHADTRSGQVTYMNSYYYIGHFSRFIRPGARRVLSSSMRDDILTTAFLNPDGKVIVVALNVSDKARPLWLCLGEQGAKVESPAHSIVTAVLSTSGGL